MVERERWIIYPLLFFALLLAARDRMIPPNPLKCPSIECSELTVRSQDGRDLVRMGGSLDSGVIIVYGPSHAIDADSLNLQDNEHLLELGTSDGGGYVTAFGPPDAPTLKLGHLQERALSGLIAVDDADQAASQDSPGDEELWGPTVLWKTNSEDAGTPPVIESPQAEAPSDETSGPSDTGE